jgi:hypothetical protein
MSRAFPFLLLISGLWAQTEGNLLDKAPPEVDAALRERITRFYQAHVDRKLIRQADQFVAEDTKDFFFESNKPSYLEFQIDKITYSDDFTKAKAIVKCKMVVNIPGFPNTPMTVPAPSTWKIENGLWYWYVDQKLGYNTPFGRMKPAEGAATGGGLPSMASAPDIQSLWKSVQADKSSVELSAGKESSGEVTISSKMPGAVTLRLDYSKTPGLEVALDRTELKSGEQAKMSLRFQPQKKPTARTVEVRVMVEPTNQLIPIAVTIQ